MCLRTLQLFNFIKKLYADFVYFFIIKRKNLKNGGHLLRDKTFSVKNFVRCAHKHAYNTPVYLLLPTNKPLHK